MKVKSLLIVVLLIWTFSANAQLKVLSNGKVGIGTTNPSQKLEVNGNIRLANSGGLLYKVKGICFTWSSSYGLNNYHGIFSTDKGSPYSDDITLNSYGNIRLNFDSNNNGTNEFSIGSNTRYGSNTRFYISDNGLVGIGTSSPIRPLQIYRSGNTIMIDPVNCPSIGSSTDQINFWYSSSTGHNRVYAQSFSSVSDIRLKENITDLNDGLDKILKLKGVKFNFKDDKRNKLGKKSFKIGFIAQELEKVLPELVSETKGYKAINYSGVIPVLVEAMKEQQKEIEQLKSEINSLKDNKGNKKSGSLSGNNKQSGLTPNSPILYQNMPNPFTNETKINYYLPDDTQKASLLIFNMQGTEIKNIKINQFENNSVSIKGSELKAGMYFYTLTANGKEIDTKKMILTK